jgi:transcription termination/antitermination protein NusA
MKNISQLFIDRLNVDEVIAQVLVTEGFSSVEAVAYVPIDDLTEIEGFDQKVAEELRERALVSLKEAEEGLKKDIEKLNISEELIIFEGLSPSMLVKLGNANIKNINDLADLASDELKEILEGIDISSKDADDIIMKARAGWFEEDDEENKDEVKDESKAHK